MLNQKEAHVWRASLQNAEHEDYFRLLSPEEQARAEHFKFDIHRQFFVTTRGILRSLLGKYLVCDPAKLRFDYNEHGKPCLKLKKFNDLRFNLSHSHGIALFAFCYGADIGVDVEYIDAAAKTDRLAERFFSPLEQEQLRTLPKELRCHGFFLGWARKEAYLKARGKGLTLALSSFDVSVDPRQTAAILSIRDQNQSSEKWTLVSLFPGEQFTAALAIEEKSWKISCWNFPPSRKDET